MEDQDDTSECEDQGDTSKCERLLLFLLLSFSGLSDMNRNKDFEEALNWHDYQIPSDEFSRPYWDTDCSWPGEEHLPPPEISGAVTSQGACDLIPPYEIPGILPPANDDDESTGLPYDTNAAHAFSSVDPTLLSLNAYQQHVPATESPFSPDSSSYRTQGAHTL